MKEIPDGLYEWFLRGFTSPELEINGKLISKSQEICHTKISGSYFVGILEALEATNGYRAGGDV